MGFLSYSFLIYLGFLGYIFSFFYGNIIFMKKSQTLRVTDHLLLELWKGADIKYLRPSNIKYSWEIFERWE